MGVASLSASRAQAQDASLALAPIAANAAAPAAPATGPANVGPTLDAASVAVRHSAVPTAQSRHGGSAPGTALMIVGGAAILVGLVIGGGAGAAIAVGGAVAGLIGLYQYLQ
jgi:hypothetical protein